MNFSYFWSGCTNYSEFEYFSFSTDGDVLCFIDFRADRMRQINEAFGIKPPFETDVIPKDLVSIYKHWDKWCKTPLTEESLPAGQKDGLYVVHVSQTRQSLKMYT